MEQYNNRVNQKKGYTGLVMGIIVALGLTGALVKYAINSSKINKQIDSIKTAQTETKNVYGDELYNITKKELKEAGIEVTTPMIKEYMAESIDKTVDKFGKNSVSLSRMPDKNGFYMVTFTKGQAELPDLGPEGIAYFK